MKGSGVVAFVCFLFAFATMGFFMQGSTALASSTSQVPASIVVSPNPASVAQGMKVTFTATVYDSAHNAITGEKVVWSVGKVSGCSISKGVLSVADTTVAANYAGLVSVAVKSNAKISAQATVTVTPVPASVVISPTKVTVAQGGQAPFTAIAYDHAHNAIAGEKLTWSVANVAGCTVSQNGVLSVAPTVAPGSYSGLVSVAVTSNPKIDSHAKVTIAQAPASVVVSPSQPAVAQGKQVSFTATVYDASNKKISGEKLIWSVANVAGCTVSQDGVLSVAATTVPGTYAGLVTVAVASNPKTSAQIKVVVTQNPFAGGVFIGQSTYTPPAGGSLESDTLAVSATATNFKALLFDEGGLLYEGFSGTIDQHGQINASFTNTKNENFAMTGSVKYQQGVLTSVSGTLVVTSGQKSSTGQWQAAVMYTTGVGPKTGAWSIPIRALNGKLGAVFNSDHTISATATEKSNGQLTGNPVAGTWTSAGVKFTLDYDGTTVHGTGTYSAATKKASGNITYEGMNVGTWSLSDL